MQLNRSKFEPLNLNLDEQFYERCEKFVALLQQWGKVHNFTAELETAQIEKNIIDSLYPLQFINSFSSFADIGTGAGYPGLLIAIAQPHINGALIESRSKRCAFLSFVKNALKLENLEVICARVEEVENQEPFDLITSRAVTNTSLLLQLTKNISDEHTSYLFYKGSMLKEELQEAKLNNYKIINVHERNYLHIQGQQ